MKRRSSIRRVSAEAWGPLLLDEGRVAVPARGGVVWVAPVGVAVRAASHLSQAAGEEGLGDDI